MNCPYCKSTNTYRSTENTKSGDIQYQCRQCGKQYDEKISATYSFTTLIVIVLCVLVISGLLAYFYGYIRVPLLTKHSSAKETQTINCPLPQAVTQNLTRPNWTDATQTQWSTTFVYRQVKKNEKVLGMFQAVFSKNSLSCYYNFGKPGTKPGGAQWLIVQSQLSGLEKLKTAGYNWKACKGDSCTSICNASSPASCPVYVETPNDGVK